MHHPADRLAALSDAEFATFAERLGRVWPDYDAVAAPATPEGVVEVSLVRERPDRPDDADRPADPERAVLRVSRESVTLEEVNEFAVFAAERGLAFAVLATVDEVTREAAARARAAPVEVYDGVGLVSMARDAGVEIPTPSDESSDDPDTERR